MKFYKNAKVVFPDSIRDCVVVTDNGKIVDITEHFEETPESTIIDCKGLYLAPGFVDIHVHGGGNKSAMSEDPDDIVKMAEAHLKYGTTSIVPTTLAAPVEQLKNVINSIKKASEKSEKANILGVHLEGPYISMQYKGAQSPENILNPKKNPPDELFELWDKILIMGAAPECEGVLELGDKLRNRGIVASVAHSAASFEQVEEAVVSHTEGTAVLMLPIFTTPVHPALKRVFSETRVLLKRDFIWMNLPPRPLRIYATSPKGYLN